MDIGSVLSRAWQIIWKHKVLWIFGILAGCANGNQRLDQTSRSSEEQTSHPNMQNFFNNLQDWQIALIIGAAILVGPGHPGAGYLPEHGWERSA